MQYTCSLQEPIAPCNKNTFEPYKDNKISAEPYYTTTNVNPIQFVVYSITNTRENIKLKSILQNTVESQRNSVVKLISDEPRPEKHNIRQRRASRTTILINLDLQNLVKRRLID